MKAVIGANGMGLETHLEELRAEFPQVDFVYEPSRDNLAATLADADIYMGWINREIFLAAKQIKWIQSPSSGTNYYVAIPELVASDVLLTSAVGTHSSCLADSIMGMLLSFTRGIRQFIFRQQKHEWSLRELRNTLCELTNQTIGLIGFGSVGRATAKRAQAFDMRILAVDAYPGVKPDYVESLTGLEGLPRLLAESDAVVVSVPYTKDTDHMFGADQFAQMKDGAYLIVISRGGIVDEEAMIAALHSGKLAGAASDVFSQEPLPADSPLWDEPNLLITPHAAGGTQYEGAHVMEIFKQNMSKFLKGDLPLRNQVNKELGW